MFAALFLRALRGASRMRRGLVRAVAPLFFHNKPGSGVFGIETCVAFLASSYTLRVLMVAVPLSSGWVSATPGQERIWGCLVVTFAASRRPSLPLPSRGLRRSPGEVFSPAQMIAVGATPFTSRFFFLPRSFSFPRHCRRATGLPNVNRGD